MASKKKASTPARSAAQSGKPGRPMPSPSTASRPKEMPADSNPSFKGVKKGKGASKGTR